MGEHMYGLDERMARDAFDPSLFVCLDTVHDAIVDTVPKRSEKEEDDLWEGEVARVASTRYSTVNR